MGTSLPSVFVSDLQLRETLHHETYLQVISTKSVHQGSRLGDCTCDSNISACEANAWPVQVTDDNADSVLHVADVRLADGVEFVLEQRWQESLAQKAATRPLCSGPQEFVELLMQVLSRDIRSLHQRLQHEGSLAEKKNHRGQGSSHVSQYRVMLDGMDVLYNFDRLGGIEIVDVDIDHLYGETNS